MAIRKIARMGHPVLRRRASEVTSLDDPELARLLTDMAETMADAGGAGLAAPQVYAAQRVVMFRLPPGREGVSVDDVDLGLSILINPLIEPVSDETALGWEGCLSVPGLRGLVPRYTQIRYTALAPDGSAIAREAGGFHARVVQHECDHLDGILYPQRMADLSQLIFESEWRAFAEAEPVADA